MRKTTWVAGGLGLLEILLVVFPSPASTLPLFHKTQLPLKTTKSCVNPEECCMFVGITDDFNKCCKDHGCCPLNCHGTLIGKSRSLTPDCDDGWECCRFHPQTQEFHQCCSAHGCCPPCSQVSKGCCLNGMRYDWGSVVEEFPELCMQMVCAAEVSTSSFRPALDAVIVPVAQTSLQCEEKPCNDCVNYQCVDKTGLVRPEGDTWDIEGCQECACRDGTVRCHRLEVECPPQPYSHCIEVPGPCCPDWDCPIPPPDCSAVLCAGPPEPNCRPIIPPGECCAVDWVCPDCSTVLCAGPPEPNCRPIIPPGECCAVDWVCPNCSTVRCAGPPQPNCHPVIPVGECCAVDWECPDCSTVRCAGPPQPNCHPVIPVGECCAVDWECPDCSAVLCAGPPEPNCRPIIPPGECCAVDWVCPDCSAVLCEGPPEPHCIPITPEGECCAVDYICGCVDRQGVIRGEGDTWEDPSDPCSHCFCSKGDARCFVQDCAPPPPWPCYPSRFPGQCCPNYCDPPEDYFD